MSISDAARSGDTAGIQQAVAAGASLDAVDRLGDTARHHAYRADRPESVQCLLELGAKAGIKNRAGLVPSDLVDLSRVEALVLDGRSCLSMSGRQWIDEAKGRRSRRSSACSRISTVRLSCTSRHPNGRLGR
jgi:hypothetical protein